MVQYAKISVGYGTDRYFFEDNSTFEIESGDVGGYPHYTSEDGLWAIAVCSRQWHIQKHERRYGLRAMFFSTLLFFWGNKKANGRPREGRLGL